MKTLKCPICDEPLNANSIENIKAIYIAEDTGSSTEYYDSIERWDCKNNHNIYIPPGDTLS